MMRRILYAILALLPMPALAALPAVTITRTLSAPDGTRPQSGTIRATLGPVAATYSGDGQTTVVSGSVVGTVSAGVATITLAPNDVLTPSGTIYAVSVSSDKPRLSWSETWSVASSGAVTRIGVAPGVTLPPTVVYGLDAALSGAACSAPAVASDTGRIYGCTAGNYVAGTLYASASDLAAHASRTDNPHAVTYSQTGALGATAQATDAAKLNGQSPAYYATAAALAGKLDSTAQAADSGKLGGYLPSYYAQDSLVSHLAGAETITGVKTFAQSGTGVGIEVKNSSGVSGDSRSVRITNGDGTYYWDLITLAGGALKMQRNGSGTDIVQFFGSNISIGV
ncbi:MAG: hypothetical protein ABFD84_14055, partial [Candidatus Polarisedimenticolia bacterium]